MDSITLKIQEIIKLYKEDFSRIDEEERYKWVAVKHFQDNWNLEAQDFTDMLERSFAKHVNLLAGNMYWPLAMLLFFTRQHTDEMRKLFRMLYDESQPIHERIDQFQKQTNQYCEIARQSDPKCKSSYQSERTICVYLAFRYPEKYYLFKPMVFKALQRFLGYEGTGSNREKYNDIINRFKDIISADEELIAMSRARLSHDCYQDPAYCLLATDVGYFASKLQEQRDEKQKLAAKPAIVLEFKKWLEAPTRNNGKPYDYKTIKVYIKQIENETKKLVPPYEGSINLYNYETQSDFLPVQQALMNIINTKESQVNGAFPKVLRRYAEFLSAREQRGEAKETENPERKPRIFHNVYNREKFLDEVFLADEDYDSLINQLIRKKNLILQGAPGVGKTFIAKRLVYSLIGEVTSERTRFVQFHQSYSYEDFVIGYRPDDIGFKIVNGAFYNFCKEAKDDVDNDWYFIIDEINRGNISKIFGELLMLIEADKRGKDYAVCLQGTQEPFFVPDNVYIIGMMNTADRSIALIDYALRRRFAFYTIEPAFEGESFRDYMESKNSDTFVRVINLIAKLNDEIAADPLLGEGFRIGHSYFCTDDPVDSGSLRDIILFEIKPLLAEYWVDDFNRVQAWTSKLLEAAQ